MSVLPVGAATGAVWPSPDSSQIGTQGGLTEATTATSATSAQGAGGASGAAGSGNGFADMLGNAINSVQSTQANADNLATQAATGGLTNVTDYMVAAEQANIQTQLTSAVRNNALQAFQQIMGMQL